MCFTIIQLGLAENESQKQRNRVKKKKLIFVSSYLKNFLSKDLIILNFL